MSQRRPILLAPPSPASFRRAVRRETGFRPALPLAPAPSHAVDPVAVYPPRAPSDAPEAEGWQRFRW